jgi:polysaccharide pyruvyl transferase WcaK-like protein
MPNCENATLRVLIYCAAGGNSGDDYILRSLVAQLREIDRNCHITVACPNSIDLAKFGCDTRVNTFNQLWTFYVGRTWVRNAAVDFSHTLRKFRESSIIIVGGGGLINDQFGVSWLSQWLLAPMIARLLGKRCAAIGIGVGPIRTRLARTLANHGMRFFDTITVRDRFSRSELPAAMQKQLKVTLAVDPAFFGKQINAYSRRKVGSKAPIFMLMVPRFDTDSNQQVKNFIAALRDLAGHNMLALAASSKRELLILRDWVDSLYDGLSRKIDVYDGSDFAEMIRFIKDASVLITMRMHPAIFAFNVGTRLLTVESYDPKLRSVSQLVGCANVQLDLRSPSDIKVKAELCFQLAAKSEDPVSEDVIDNIDNGLNKIRNQLSSLIAADRTETDNG